MIKSYNFTDKTSRLNFNLCDDGIYVEIDYFDVEPGIYFIISNEDLPGFFTAVDEIKAEFKANG